MKTLMEKVLTDKSVRNDTSLTEQAVRNSEEMFGAWSPRDAA